MTMLLGLCLAAVALAQSAGQGQPSPGPNPDPSDARGQGMGRSDQGTGGGTDRAGDHAMPAGSRLTAQIDQQFEQDWVKHAYSGNNFEVQLGQLVNDKARDPQLKRIAQRMIDDHRQANQQLKQVAQAMNVDVSEELNPVHQAKLQHCQQKQGAQLELGFVFGQIGQHTTALLEHQFIATNAQNAQLKQYAAQCVPKLRDHAQMLMQIAPIGEARTAGERMPPAGGTTGGTGGGGRTGDR